MTMEAMLAEILAKLEEMPALWTPSSPPSIPTHIAESDEDQERGVRASAGFPNSTPSTTSATGADSGFQSSVTELPDPHVSIDGHLGILFEADGGGVDRLSRLPESLLHDIISRLPIKDAARTAVLSRRWSPIWRAAPPLVDPVDHAVLHLNSNRFCGLVPVPSELVNRPLTAQARLSFRSVDLLPARDPTRKVAVNLFKAASTSSPTSAPTQVTALESQFGITELLVMAHTRCSTPSPYNIACIPVSQEVVLAIPIMVTEHIRVTHARCLMLGRDLDTAVVKPAASPLAVTLASRTCSPPLDPIIRIPHISTE